MSSVALSLAAVARPGVACPAQPAMVAAQSHSRSMWRAARNCQDGPEKVEHTFRPMNKNEAVGSNARSRFSGFSAGREPFWSEDREQLLTRMQSMKKEMLDEHVQLMKEMRSIKKGISKDPLSAIFGRKIDIFREFEKHAPFRPGFLRPFPNSRGKCSGPSHPPKASEEDKTTETAATEFNRDALEYDPISGRMVPRQYETAEGTTQSTPVGPQPDSNVDKTLDLNPLINNGPFPPAPNFASRHFISTPLSPKPVEYSPGDGTLNKEPINFKKNEFAASFQPEIVISKEAKANDFEAQKDPMAVSGDSSASPAIKQDEGLVSDSSAHVDHMEVAVAPGERTTEYPTHYQLASLGGQPHAMQASTSHGVDLPSSTAQKNHWEFGTSALGDGDSPPKADILREQKSDSELETSMEDSEPLNATDIRSRYTSMQGNMKPDAGVTPTSMGEPTKTEATVTEGISRVVETATTEPFVEAEITVKTFPVSAFRILTYDASDSQVTVTGADSFFETNKTNSLSEIFSRLQNPGKFVPYFPKMEKDGYEIVTGGGDILVFRNTASFSTLQSPLIDTQTSTSHGSSSSSGGSSISAPSSTIQSASTSSKRKSSSSNILSRMLLGGMMTAASCYAIGVVSEYFRTGGTDGRGPQGFTPFEAERRYRD